MSNLFCKFYICFILNIFGVFFCSCVGSNEGGGKSQNIKEYLPNWQKGYLDIHQITTGRGNCAFFMLPDGTTMMIDAGDLGNPKNEGHEIMDAVPSDSLRPAKWIVKYIKHFDPKIKALNYVLLTHFHSDHIGQNDDYAVSLASKNYKLSGITYVANLLPINTLIDRGYPDYNYPTKDLLLSYNQSNFPNYYEYIEEREKQGLEIQGFKVGSNTQFELKNSPEEYSNFEIRNIYANGKMWTGEGSSVKNLFPEDIEKVATSSAPGENGCCCAIRLTYGKFSYFSGGDILGSGNPYWLDVETPIGALIGHTDVVVADHHGYSDAMNSSFIKSTSPQAFVIPAWDYYHPQPQVLSRMLDTTLYEGDRMVFAAGMVPDNRYRLGEQGQEIKPEGHIVVRVYPPGDTFQIFVLNEHSLDYEIIYKTSILKSK